MLIKPDIDVEVYTSGKVFKLKLLERVEVILSRMDVGKAEIACPLLRVGDLSAITTGDEVKIYLMTSAYKGGGATCVFWGVISEMDPGDRLKFSCEDFLSRGRDVSVTKRVETGKRFSKIAAEVINEVGLNPIVWEGHSSDITVGTFYIDEQSALSVLDEIKRRTGWLVYMIPGTKTAYCGPVGAYSNDGPLQQEHMFVYHLSPYSDPDEGDRPSNVIKNGLRWHAGHLYSRVIVYLCDSEFVYPAIKGEWGEGDGPTLVRTFSEKLDENSADVAVARAREIFVRENSEGYEGDITVFGNPFIYPEHVVYLSDTAHPERTGEFLVEKLIHKYSTDGGFKTQIYLAPLFEEVM